MTKAWTKLHLEELYKLYYRKEKVACSGEIRNAHEIRSDSLKIRGHLET
jgi:hypothetical protein